MLTWPFGNLPAGTWTQQQTHLRGVLTFCGLHLIQALLALVRCFGTVTAWGLYSSPHSLSTSRFSCPRKTGGLFCLSALPPQKCTEGTAALLPQVTPRLPQLALTMFAHPPFPQAPLCTSLSSHTAESPFPTPQPKPPLMLDGHLAETCRGASAMGGSYLPCKDTIQKKTNPRSGNRVCLSNPACHVDLHQGTPSPRQPSRSPFAISSSGMKMQNDKPWSCGVFPRALTFPIQSPLPQAPQKWQNPQSSIFFSSSVARLLAVTQQIQKQHSPFLQSCRIGKCWKSIKLL